MVVGLLGNKSPDSNRFKLVTPKSENDARLQATLGNQDPTGLLVGVVSECLKKSGLEIKDIRQFFQWVAEGPSSYEKRKGLFEARKVAVEEELKELEKTLSLLKFKCWYYETAMKDGNEDGIHAMLPDKLPAEIQKLYNDAHENSQS